jgi:predicted DNA binding CopG/RHH family protein
MAKMTEAQKRAALKYQRTLGQFSIKLPKPELERYKAAAEQAGMPFRAWVLVAMDEKMKEEER